jgi:hypothetical protein
VPVALSKNLLDAVRVEQISTHGIAVLPCAVTCVARYLHWCYRSGSCALFSLSSYASEIFLCQQSLVSIPCGSRDCFERRPAVHALAFPLTRFPTQPLIEWGYRELQFWHPNLTYLAEPPHSPFGTFNIEPSRQNSKRLPMTHNVIVFIMAFKRHQPCGR